MLDTQCQESCVRALNLEFNRPIVNPGFHQLFSARMRYREIKLETAIILFEIELIIQNNDPNKLKYINAKFIA